MTYFQMPEGMCPITGWTFFNGPKNHDQYKKQKREKYRAAKKEKPSVVVAMYDKQLNLTIVE
jgi:hypothetical protein